MAFCKTPLKTWKTAKCPPEKGHSPLSQQPPLKIKNLGGGRGVRTKLSGYARMLKTLTSPLRS